jgi:poly(3-hydroxybutyrate) depolymerase
MACNGGGASGGNADRSDGAQAEGRQAPADCDPARAARATDDPQTFSFDGEERAYLLALPDDYDGTTAHPLLFSFHGFSSNKEGQNAYAFDAHGRMGGAAGDGT